MAERPEGPVNRQLNVRPNLLQIPLSNMTISKKDIICRIGFTLETVAKLITRVIVILLAQFSQWIITPYEYIFCCNMLGSCQCINGSYRSNNLSFCFKRFQVSCRKHILKVQSKRDNNFLFLYEDSFMVFCYLYFTYPASQHIL